MNIDPTQHDPRDSRVRTLYLLYHELRPSGSNYSYVTNSETFERHLDLFQRLRTSGETDLYPEITFDDGHISNFEYALPALKAKAMSACFFITVGWTAKRQGYMGWAELRDLLSGGQKIGAHGWTHTLLTHCDASSLKKELLDARLMLEDQLGQSVTTMSLPGGRYNENVLTACRDAGYTQVFTSVPQATAKTDAALPGRLNIRGDMTLEWIEGLFQPESKTLAGLERQYKVKTAAKAILGDKVYEKIWAILNRKEQEVDVQDTANEDHTHHQ